MSADQPEPLSGPDQLMHLELLIATLKHCQETGTPFDRGSLKDHPLMQDIRARAKQRALAMIRESGVRLRNDIEFQNIIDHLGETR